jgi:hypothetical protein
MVHSPQILNHNVAFHSLVVLTIPAAARPRASLYYDLALSNNNRVFSVRAEDFLKVLINDNRSVSYKCYIIFWSIRSLLASANRQILKYPTQDYLQVHLDWRQN